MAEESFLLLLFIGLTSLGVFFYYNRLLQNVLNVLKTLLKLQESKSSDIRRYIASIESQLKKHTDVICIDYELHYHDKTVLASANEECSKGGGVALKKDIYYDAVQGVLTLYVRNDKGENKLINRLVLYVVALQIVNAVHAEIEKTNESFQRIAKLQTYMLHDIKNILQFLQTLQYNLDSLKTHDEKERFIEYLKVSLEPVNKKVANILSLLEIASQEPNSIKLEKIDLQTIVEPLIKRYMLRCTLMPKTLTVYADKEMLETIFENILSNIAYKKIETQDLTCRITIEQSGERTTIKIQDDGKPFASPELVTQPFYSTKKGGLGIGMYQSYLLAKSLGIELVCLNENGKATVCLKFSKRA